MTEMVETPDGAEPGWYGELQPLSDQLQRTSDPAIRLGKAEITWGTDSDRATKWSDDEMLEPVHCRLWFGEDHHYHLEAVTPDAEVWVNFHPIAAEAVSLVHGDVVQFGSLVFRYMETPPQTIKNLEVLPYNI